MLSPSFPSSSSSSLTATITNQSSPPRYGRYRSELSTAAAAGATTPSTASFYEILEIPASASSGEIKAAYRRLARVHHPDTAAIGDRNDSAAAAADEFMKLHAAYSTLSDPQKRASYDRSLFRRLQRPLTAGNSTAARFSGYSGRNWETDQCW